jgi:TPR repeat protein
MGGKVRERKDRYRYLTFGLLTLVISTSLAFSACGRQFEDATVAYERGDYEEAYRILKPLAEQGYPKSQHDLGVMYAKGQGVPQDYVLAYMWFTLAASRFPSSELKRLQTCLRNIDLAASKMTPDQIAEAQWLVREWKPKKEVR